MTQIFFPWLWSYIMVMIALIRSYWFSIFEWKEYLFNIVFCYFDLDFLVFNFFTSMWLLMSIFEWSTVVVWFCLLNRSLYLLINCCISALTDFEGFLFLLIFCQNSSLLSFISLSILISSCWLNDWIVALWSLRNSLFFLIHSIRASWYNY